jgi:hypothetical protein
MPKVVGNVKEWASDAVFTVGDYVGSDTKVDGGSVIDQGFVPGDVFAPTGEETNFELNQYSRILQWVQDGSNLGSADAHLVETNSGGEIHVQRVVAVNTDGIDLNGGDFTGNGVGDGVTGRSIRTGVRGISTAGANPAVWGQHQNSGDGVRGESTTGRGVYGLGGGAGAGVRGDGGASGPGGLFNGFGGSPDIDLSPSLNYGIDIACATDALGGIRILCNGQTGLQVIQDDPDEMAALFWGDAAATLGVGTVEMRAFGGGDALHLIAATGTGYALTLTPKVAAPTRGAISCNGQTARPTVIDGGQLTWLGTEGQWAISAFNDFGQPGPGVGWRGVWSSTGGFALGYRTLATTTLDAGINVYKTIASITATAANAPKLAGRTILLRVMMEARCSAAVAACLNIKVFDDTADPVNAVFTRAGVGAGLASGFQHKYESINWERPVCFLIELTVPAAGTRTWRIDGASAQADTISVRHVSIDFQGMT